MKVRNIFKWSMLLNETLQRVLFFFTSQQHGSISRSIYIDLMVTECMLNTNHCCAKTESHCLHLLNQTVFQIELYI